MVACVKAVVLAAMLALPISALAWSETDYTEHKHRAEQYMCLYEQASIKHNVPLPMLLRMGSIESGFWKPSIVTGKRPSKHGAIGIAQFMPKTAKALGVNPRDIASSIDGQAKYLRMLFDQFKSWKYAAMAYNWGEGNLRKGIRNKRIPKSVKRYASFTTKEL